MFAQKRSLPQVKQFHWNCLKRCSFSWQSQNRVWQWQVKIACVHLETILLYALKRPLLTQLRKVRLYVLALCRSLAVADRVMFGGICGVHLVNRFYLVLTGLDVVNSRKTYYFCVLLYNYKLLYIETIKTACSNNMCLLK